MAKQLIFRDEARRRLKAGMDKMAQAVAITLGPKGRNVALDQKWGAPLITHDGVTVAKEMAWTNPFENMGAQLLKETAVKTNEMAGDGTTTTIVLAHTMVSEGLKNMAAGANPMLLKRGIEKATTLVSAALKAQARPICSRAEMANVAAIAAQDREIGELIAAVLDKVGPDGVVTIEDGRGLNLETEYVEGMQFDRGYLSPFFITHAEEMITVLEEPYLLLSGQKINRANDLTPLLEKLVRLSNRNLLVIADDVEGEALTTLVLNKLQGTLNLVAVKAPGFGEQRKAMLQDIAILTGGTVVSEDMGRRPQLATLADLGCCARVVVGKDETILMGGYGKAEVLKARISQLKAEIEHSTNGYDKEKLQQRLAALTGSIAIIKVGAASGVELKEKKQRVQDALSATRSAVKAGIVPGGGIALLNTACALARMTPQNLDEAAAVNIVRRALEEPLRLIARNAGLEGAVIVANVRCRQQAERNDRIGYNVVLEQYQDMVQAGIIDPTQVTRSALENAASIAAMILTVEVLVTDSLEG
ncbi:MAG: chaperonin GroEL [Anaerolineae bacterium]|nr:chaperonin GroEL [Anaerolineales bacterium]MCQ3979698.1 chaperonin GroEL [Anaerolineae bacterium]